MNFEYNSVFMPLVDVYSLAGRDVFFELQRKEEEGKNLIILPRQLLKNEKGEGIKDALNYLVESERSIREISENKEIIYSFGDSLDVIYSADQDCDSFVKRFAKENKDVKVLTTDSKKNLEWRVKGIKTEKPKFLIADAQITTKGIRPGPQELLAMLRQNKGYVNLDVAESILQEELFINQFILFGKEYAIVEGNLIRNKNKTRIISVENPRVRLFNEKDYNKEIYLVGEQPKKDGFFEIFPRDMEQFIAVQKGILNPDVEICFICGGYGSGKTILGYTTAVDLILAYDKEIAQRRGAKENKRQLFEKILLLKPNELIGGDRRNEGFRPGTLWEKLRPHLKSFEDAHRQSKLDCIPFYDMILHPKRASEYGPPRSEETNKTKFNQQAYLPSNREAIEIEPASFFRGRSLKNTLILVDEAQNFTPGEMRNIISRIAEDSKIIILGDPEQVDNPYCSRDINGLTSSIKQFMREDYSFLFNLSKNQRSQASEDALNWRVY